MRRSPPRAGRSTTAVAGDAGGRARRLLLRVAELLERDKDALARAESLDTGKRLVESEYDMDDIANCFRYFGNLARPAATDRVVDTGSPGDRQPGACTSRSACAR